jgi:hypothetical protein
LIFGVKCERNRRMKRTACLIDARRSASGALEVLAATPRVRGMPV